MNKKLLGLFITGLLAVSALSVGSADPQGAFALHNGDRVVMYGDSITAQQLYTNYAEAFVVTRFPNLKVDWWSAGWGGDRVGGGGGGPIDVRLQRDVLAYKPTLVTVMLGMNDGGYRPFDQALFDTYQKGYQHIIDVIKKADPASRMTLILPSPFDDVTQTPKFEGGYNAVLIKYGDCVKALAQANGFGVADFNTAVDDVLAKAKDQDATLAQKIVPDRVHPSPAGHLVMAETLLKSWGFPSIVSAVSIDAAAGKVAQSSNTAVTKLNAGATVTWDELDNALPLPIAFNDPVIALVIKSSDIVSALDQETLQVTGLNGPKYELKIDDKTVGTFAKEDLAAGINLATMSTPMSVQAAAVLGLTNQHDNLHGMQFRNIQQPLQNDSFPPVKSALAAAVAGLNQLNSSLMEEQRATAEPVLHHYSLAAAQ